MQIGAQSSSRTAMECGSYGGRAEKPWYCLELHPGALDLAQRHLTFQKFQTWRPAFQEIRKRPAKDGSLTREVALFPGYLFVTFDVERDPWQRLFFTHGVKYLFRRTDGYPALLPKDAVALADQQSAELTKAVLARYAPALIAKGDEVEVTQGPMKGFRALVQLQESERVHVLLSIMGRSTQLSLARNAVRKV